MTLRHTAAALAALLLGLAPIPASAQDATGTIRGTVAAAAGAQPLADARVTVRAAGDTAVVAATNSGADGAFVLRGVSAGRYDVRVELLGWTPAVRSGVAVTAGEPVADLGTVSLEPAAVALEGLTATADRASMRVAADRTAYSTADMPAAAGGVATDVLRSVPELQVDVDGDVTLRGTAARIFLNGRPTPMQGEALQQFLQQFPADRIDRVEVIANPSARFQAEGAGGIVNIVLKEDVDLGLSGSVFANGSSRGDVGGGGRLAYQEGRVTLFGGGFARLSRRRSDSYTLRRNLLADPVTELEQDGWDERDGRSGNFDLTAELELTDRSTIWGQAGVYGWGNDGSGSTEYLLTEIDGPTLERYRRVSDSDGDRGDLDLSAGWRWVVEPARHELTAEIRRERGTDDDRDRIERIFLAADGSPSGEAAELTLDGSDEDERETSAEVNYVRPWGEGGKVEVGYRAEIEEQETDRVVETFEAASSVPGETDRRGYLHREEVHSGYVTVHRTLGRLGLQLGTRVEHSDVDFEVPSTGDTFGGDRLDLFPSANLTWDAGGGREVRFSYSRRVRRPSAWVMNPVDRSSDPLNRYVGNPDIDPQYVHSFGLETSWVGTAGTLRVSPYYRRTLGDWTQIKTVDADGVSTVTWENLASIDAYGTSFTASLRETKGISGFASLSGFREVRDAGGLSFDYSGDATRWSAHANVSARVSPSLALQGMAFYTPARDVPQGRIGSRVMTHLSARQKLLDDKLTVSLVATDPFDLMRNDFRTSDATHVQVSRGSWSFRSVRLSVSYAFGRPPRSARGRNRGMEEPQQEEAPPTEIH